MLTSVDAEVYTPIGQRVKRRSPTANTVVVTLANGKSSSGHAPDDSSLDYNTFQVLNSHLNEGCAEAAIGGRATTLVVGHINQQQ